MSRFTVPIRQSQKGQRDITFAILASAQGHRMKSYCPKAMIPVNRKEVLLDLTLERILSEYPRSDIVIVTGFKSEAIEKKIDRRIRIVENQLYDQTNSLEEARLAINNCTNSRIVLLSGDLMFNSQTIKNIARGDSCLIYDDNDQIQDDDVGMSIISSKVVNMSYGLDK